MSTSKAKGNKAIVKANTNAINLFPKQKIRNRLDKIADASETLSGAKSQSDNSSLEIAEIAAVYAVEAHAKCGDDHATVMNDWRDNMAVLTMELAVAGHKLAALTPAEGDKPAKATLQGSGNNVMSTAKGVVDFQLDIAECAPVNEAGEYQEISYRAVQKAVQVARAARRDAADPAAALYRAAVINCKESFTDLLDYVSESNDIIEIEGLTAALATYREELKAIRETQDAAEADTVDEAIADEIAKVA